MAETLPAGAAAALRVRFAAAPASVPEVRRFVSERVDAWGLGTLADDAALCVSELATNAAVHSRGGFMEVALEALDRGVRISVEDEGVHAEGSMTPRHHYADGLDGVEDPLTSGRGLAIVSFLASEWGVTPTGLGKRVWVELRT